MKPKIEEQKLKRREEKEARKELAIRQREEKNRVTRAEKNRRRKKHDENDWDDLAMETRLVVDKINTKSHSIISL